MTTTRKPLTQTQRKHHYYMGDAMRRLEWDLHNHLFEARRIPSEWHDISTRRESPKSKICFSVDEDVVKWFKSMGPGYQPRMNDVLRTFMHAKLAGLIKGEETIEPFQDHEEAGARRPYWGWVEEQMAEIRRE
jgi:uncharacterized protein (DUF4415 family)